MKLYTEKQVIKAIDLSRLQGAEPYLVKYREEEILNMITPIVIPSDEEIEKTADRIAEEDGYDIEGGKVADFVDGIFKGAKWIIKQIINQNK